MPLLQDLAARVARSLARRILDTVRQLMDENFAHALSLCMGYSLPESDLTMKHFLRTTCPAKSLHVAASVSEWKVAADGTANH